MRNPTDQCQSPGQSECTRQSDHRAARVLVTGGAGFVGSHLCDQLIRQNKRVICLDNFDTGSEANVAHLLSHPNFRLVEADVTTPLDFDVEEIYNLASPASPPHYQIDPIQTTKTNVLGGLNVLELAARQSARVFQASTSEVYGDPEVHPQPEDYWGNVNPIGPRACYDEGKRCVESLCFDFKRIHNVDVRVARIFNTYGPRMRLDDGRVVSNFVVQALRGEPITVYGDGLQTRSFCYVDDLVSGILKLMSHPKAVEGPVNLGNPGEFSVRDVAHHVIDLLDSESKIEYHPLPKDDPKRRRPDISRAKSLLNWQPEIALESGLKRTARYFLSCVTTDPQHLVAAE